MLAMMYLCSNASVKKNGGGGGGGGGRGWGGARGF